MCADAVVDGRRRARISRALCIAAVVFRDPLAENPREHERVASIPGISAHVGMRARVEPMQRDIQDPHTVEGSVGSVGSNWKRPNMSLFPHQTEAVDFVLRRFEAGFGAALCYEMGLGKTFIGLGVARRFFGSLRRLSPRVPQGRLERCRGDPRGRPARIRLLRRARISSGPRWNARGPRRISIHQEPRIRAMETPGTRAEDVQTSPAHGHADAQSPL